MAVKEMFLDNIVFFIPLIILQIVLMVVALVHVLNIRIIDLVINLCGF